MNGRAHSPTRTLTALAKAGIPARATYIGDTVIIETLTGPETPLPMATQVSREKLELEGMLDEALRKGI